MNFKEYIAGITIEIMEFGFTASIGANKKIVSFENSKGNKIYITDEGDYCTIRGYRQTASAFKEIKITDPFSDHAELATHYIGKAFKVF